MKNATWWRDRRLLGFALFAMALWLLAGMAPESHHHEHCEHPDDSTETCKLCMLAMTGSIMVMAAPSLQPIYQTPEIWIAPSPVLMAGPDLPSFRSRAPPIA